jgi:hypothetical protein
MGQVGDRMLLGSGIDRIGTPPIGDDRIAGNAKFAGRRQQTDTFVAEGVRR